MKTIFDDLEPIEEKIVKYLFYNCRSKARAKTYKKLSVYLDIGSRDLRRIVSSLVTNGKACIGSTSRNGYFYVDTDDEAKHVQNELRKRALKILIRRRGSIQARKKDKQIKENEIEEKIKLFEVKCVGRSYK